MLRRILNMLRPGPAEAENLIYDLEFITGRPVTTMSDNNGRTGFVFVASIERALRLNEETDNMSAQEFAVEIVTETNRILSRYDSPICDRAREINAEILTE